VASEFFWGNAMNHLHRLLVVTFVSAVGLGLPGRAFSDEKKEDEAPGEITRLDGHKGEVIALAFAPDGKSAVSYGNDFFLRRWDLIKQKQDKEWSPGNHHFGLVFFGDGKLSVSGDSGGMLRVWNPAEGEAVGEPMKHDDGIWSVALSRSDNQAVCGCQDGVVRVWNMKTRAKQLELKIGAAVYSVAISRDGRFVLLGGADKAVRLWDLKNDRLERPLEGHTEAVFRVAFAPDGRHAFSAGGVHPGSGLSDNTIRVWDLKTFKLVRTLEVAEGRAPMHSAVFAPDGRRALTGHADGRLTLWDLQTGKALLTLTGHKEAVTCVAIAADGRRALSGGLDNSVRLWRLPAP
jgi:WD40 repeat protein